MSEPRPSPPAVSFPEAEDLIGTDVADDAVGGAERPGREVAARWWPDGGAAAVTGLVLVLVAWLGASPLVQAVSAVFPEKDQTFTPSDPSSNFGGGGYYGVSPGLIPFISFGTRAAIVVVALVLGLRARHGERSALSGACVATAAISLILLAGAAVAMSVGIAHGHQSNIYGVF